MDEPSPSDAEQTSANDSPGANSSKPNDYTSDLATLSAKHLKKYTRRAAEKNLSLEEYVKQRRKKNAAKQTAKRLARGKDAN